MRQDTWLGSRNGDTHRLADPLSWRPMIHRAARGPRRSSRRFGLQVADHLSVSGDLINLVWRHKLWWMVPLLLAMVVLAALVVLEATPIGPLLYPVF